MLNKKFPFAKIFFLVGLISLLLIYIILWMQMITSHSERTGTDFIAFYSAGRVAQEYGIRDAYHIPYQKDAQENQLEFQLADNQVLLYNHLPFLIPLLILIAQDNYIISFMLWTLIQISIYGASFYVLAQLFPKRWRKKTSQNLLLSGMLFFPIFVSLLIGQDTAFNFLGISLFIYGIFTENDFLAGAGLALTTVRPHLTLVLALPLLFKNRKAFGYFLGLGGSLVLFSIAILGLEGTKDFLRILTISGEGAWYGMKEPIMFNLVGLLIRIIPSLSINTVHIIGWSAYFFSIITLSIFWARADKIRTFHLTVAIISSLFFAPHLHYHDLSLLIIPVFLLLLSGKLPVSQKNLALVPLAISFFLIFTQPVPIFYYSSPYLLMVSLIIFMRRESKTRKKTDSFSNI